MLVTLLSAAVAAPMSVAASARLVGPAPAAFNWPEGASACRADLILGSDGVAQRVEAGRCGEALRPVLDKLVGLAFDRPGQGSAVVDVRLVPPTGEQGQSTPVLRVLEVGPVEWPSKFPNGVATVSARTSCPVTVTFESGEKPSGFEIESCPAPLKEVLEKDLARTRWTVRSGVDAPDGWTARVIFAWVDDPARPNKRLLTLEGTALPKTIVYAQYPVGMTGGAMCDAAVQVETSGMPANVIVGGCEPVWEKAARSAVQQWTFRPRIVDGEPLADDYVTTVTFSMN